MLHAVRVRMALASLKLKAWPFPGRIALRERGAMVGAEVLHVLDHWSVSRHRAQRGGARVARCGGAPGGFDAQCLPDAGALFRQPSEGRLARSRDAPACADAASASRVDVS